MKNLQPFGSKKINLDFDFLEITNFTGLLSVYQLQPTELIWGGYDV